MSVSDPAVVFSGSSEDQTTPMLVTALKGLKVVDVACGSGDAQTLAVTENGEGWRRLLLLRYHLPRNSETLILTVLCVVVDCFIITLPKQSYVSGLVCGGFAK